MMILGDQDPRPLKERLREHIMCLETKIWGPKVNKSLRSQCKAGCLFCHEKHFEQLRLIEWHEQYPHLHAQILPIHLPSALLNVQLDDLPQHMKHASSSSCPPEVKLSTNSCEANSISAKLMSRKNIGWSNEPSLLVAFGICMNKETCVTSPSTSWPVDNDSILDFGSYCTAKADPTGHGLTNKILLSRAGNGNPGLGGTYCQLHTRRIDLSFTDVNLPLRATGMYMITAGADQAMTDIAIMDSGSPISCTGDRSLLRGYTELTSDSYISGVGGEELRVHGYGNISNERFQMKGVFYIPGMNRPNMKKTIFSVSELDSLGYSLNIENGFLVMDRRNRTWSWKTLTCTGAVVGKGHINQGYYVVDFLKIPLDREREEPAQVTSWWEASWLSKLLSWRSRTQNMLLPL